ncbi:MAG: DUF4082 domain-containing protein [Patescibacteria group bacterium]
MKRILQVFLAVFLAVGAVAWWPASGSGGTVSAVSSCPTDLLSSMTPYNTNYNDTAAVNVGVRFGVRGAPFVRGVKFYKGVDNTGTHVAHLRNVTTSTDLASATFTGESGSGWQSVNFSSDVQVSETDSYMVWVSMPNGHYAVDGPFAGGTNDFSQSYGDSEDVVAIGAGSNGRYSYTSDDAEVPSNNTTNNYWVSPIVGDSTDPENNSGVSVSDATAGPSVTWSGAGADTNAVTDLGLPRRTTIQRIQGETSDWVVGEQTGGAGHWFTYGPNDPTALPGTSYIYNVFNTDACGNTSPGSTGSVTTASQSLSRVFSTNPSTLDTGQTVPTTFGLRWSTSTAGNVWGVRYYRNSGTVQTSKTSPMSVGLWDNDGTLLAYRLVPIGNKQTGWVDVRFESPVSVSANHDYVVGYFSPNGLEVYTNNTLSSAVNNGNLTATADSSGTPNGVYATGGSLTFPNTRASNATWYGVDVDFYVP